jgi:hypothetical protein
LKPCAPSQLPPTDGLEQLITHEALFFEMVLQYQFGCDADATTDRQPFGNGVANVTVAYPLESVADEPI